MLSGRYNIFHNKPWSFTDRISWQHHTCDTCQWINHFKPSLQHFLNKTIADKKNCNSIKINFHHYKDRRFVVRFPGRLKCICLSRCFCHTDNEVEMMASAPGDYLHFKARVPLHDIWIGGKQWRFYDYGPKEVPPLVCLSGVAGTADVFYKQFLSLSLKGYRVIAVDAPPMWSHQEWINSFEKFLNSIDIHHVHIYGTSLGGFFAQLFSQYRPRRVKSLVLSNAFLETLCFADAMPWSSLINWTPCFILKRYILSGIREGPYEPFIADSVDFVVSQLEELSREELASRLILNTMIASIGRLLLPESAITIMDTNDYCAIPQVLKNQLGDRYSGATKAFLKSGGDFPFLSRPDEVNLHLQLHLRRFRVEGCHDMMTPS